MSKAIIDVVMDASNDGIIQKRLDGTIETWNKAAEKIFGYTRQEILGCSIRIIIPPEFQQEEDQLIEKIRARELVDIPKTIRMDKSGKLLYLSITSVPIFDDNDKVSGVCSIVRDISELEQFKTLANSNYNLAWVARADGSIFWYNDRWYEYTGTTYEQMQGWGWQLVHDQKELPRIIKEWTKALNEGILFEQTFPLKKHDGTFRQFLTRAYPEKDKNGKLVRWFGTNTDISEILRLNKLNIQLKEFSSVVSHDLSDPLLKIEAFLPAVISNLQATPEVEEAVKIINQAVENGKRLVRDLLEYAHTPTDEEVSSTVDIEELVKDILKSYPHSDNFTIENLPKKIECNVVSIRQVFSNLIGNAYKFRHPNVLNKITIGSKDGEFFVKDNGIGIPADQLDKLGKPFYKIPSEGKYPGTGLGLAICKKVVETAGGNIRIESELNKGTSVFFTLHKAS